MARKLKKSAEFQKFEDLTRKLLSVPKKDIDEQGKEAAKDQPKPRKKPVF